MRLGYELSTRSTVLTAVSLHSYMCYKAVRNSPSLRYSSVMVILYNVQEFSTAE